ncbi:MAG: DNA topoisomerase IV subunit A [Euryarchaeota archaeon]|jgi:DNA topoisomerase-6 subunit A|nr:DNA topoisomerase IV subunit A [Euryarchaeota archaeon]MBT3971817.1 DNA topoisomerase IV subunit A [Euryarchaeota archaeon]MBT4407450.1 DNA topoisomerase IV subunit A [Euryarchaeota archaeon]MBT6644581.1 DNA topoisomerase IV subunit A [Euryarchaeota archaeon]
MSRRHSPEETKIALHGVVEEMYKRMMKGEPPTMTLPVRSKTNIGFDKKYGVFKYGKKKTIRDATSLGSAKQLLRALHVVEFIEEMIDAGKSSTLREMYYISEAWGLGHFNSQNESNNLAEDLEIVTKCLREDFKLRPEEDGARIIGNVTINELNRRGEWMRINARDDVGDSGYGLPYNVENEKIQFLEHDVKFIMAIETGGMFDRLVENGFDEEWDCALLHLKGQPARSTRRFLKRMNEEWDLPVVVFLDGDPWSFRIYASIAYGAIKTAHISEYLATPSAAYIGITPDDILAYDLPSDDLSKNDIQALKAELTDPRFADGMWQDRINLMLEMGVKSEQQSLAKYGLDYVTDTYLPEKMAEAGL